MAAIGSLLHYLSQEFNSETCADVSITIGEGDLAQKVLCHSLLLSRSEYFRTALKSSFPEGRSKDFTFVDVNPRAMVPLLKVLYTDKLNLEGLGSDFTGQDAIDMLILCERFCVPAEVLEIVKENIQASIDDLLSESVDADQCLHFLSLCTTHSWPPWLQASLLERVTVAS